MNPRKGGNNTKQRGNRPIEFRKTDREEKPTPRTSNNHAQAPIDRMLKHAQPKGPMPDRGGRPASKRRNPGSRWKEMRAEMKRGEKQQRGTRQEPAGGVWFRTGKSPRTRLTEKTEELG